MGISLAQVVLNGISTGVGSAFGAVAVFIVMRYFPRVWGALESSVTKTIVDTKSITDVRQK